MIEIGGKPVLQYNIELLLRAGIREAIVNLHYRPEAITDYFGDGRSFGLTLSYSFEPELLGTAGAARNVAAFLRNENFLVIYADNVSSIDLAALTALHRERDADLTVAAYRREDPAGSGILDFDDDGRVARFAEKPGEHEVFSRWVNAGYLVARSSILDRIPDGRTSDFGRDVIPSLIADGARVYAYRMTEPLWWIDSVADYERTKAAFESARP